MKVVILAGGFGTRISEESYLKPKPMIEIGEKPILWHIMKIYSHYGFNEFIVCLGYKGIYIKEYFHHYFLHESDITFDFRMNQNIVENHTAEPWKVSLIDTGLHTMTGGRIKRIAQYVGNEPFMVTYGDGVSNVNITGLVDFHKKHGKIATITAVQPGGRFGVLDITENSSINGFQEKPVSEGGWINGGFMVFQPEIFNYIPDGDNVVFEKEPLEKLASDKQMMAFKHDGFWQPMDALRDKNKLEELWQSKKAPWKIWEK
ncbi:MAG: glucose-1-phosphate cytidylyltransferase [Chitinispirillaceae bacterium]|nr:glucose-1-phosphate cytidylyltransferase [Chitinispirillaceae bacterium]